MSTAPTRSIATAAILILLLFLSVQSSAQRLLGPTVTGATITEPGIYAADVVQQIPAPGTAKATNENLASFKLLQATTNIRAKIGTRFGFRYTIHGSPR